MLVWRACFITVFVGFQMSNPNPVVFSKDMFSKWQHRFEHLMRISRSETIGTLSVMRTANIQNIKSAIYKLKYFISIIFNAPLLSASTPNYHFPWSTKSRRQRPQPGISSFRSKIHSIYHSITLRLSTTNHIRELLQNCAQLTHGHTWFVGK